MNGVAVVTPWFEHLELVDDYMAAIDAGPAPDELIVVDNASRPPLGFAAVRLDRNLGFSGGSNAGLYAATAEVVVFLNSDVALGQADWLDTLVSYVEDGVLAGAKLRSDPHANVDGRVLPYLDGWCLAGMREDLLDLGGFDDTLAEPSYYSDNLLCLEARAAGMTLREAPVALTHKGGQTAGPPSNPAIRQAAVANYQVYAARARELFDPQPDQERSPAWAST